MPESSTTDRFKAKDVSSGYQLRRHSSREFRRCRDRPCRRNACATRGGTRRRRACTAPADSTLKGRDAVFLLEHPRHVDHLGRTGQHGFARYDEIESIPRESRRAPSAGVNVSDGQTEKHSARADAFSYPKNGHWFRARMFACRCSARQATAG